MTNIRVGLLEKKRGNFKLQEKFIGKENVINTTDVEVQHHYDALKKAGYEVIKLKWSKHIIADLINLDVDIVFNVSSIVEAAILEELNMKYVGSNIFGIIKATDKGLAKEIWIENNLPTSPFVIAKDIADCDVFKNSAPFAVLLVMERT
jgi:D-alanine-D-alanine ligase